MLISHECEPKDYLVMVDCYRGSGRDMPGIIWTRPDRNQLKNAYRNKRKKKNSLLNLKFHSRNPISGSFSSHSSSLLPHYMTYSQYNQTQDHLMVPSIENRA